LLGRPAIAGCAPMLPRCRTSVIRHPPSALLWSRCLWSVVRGQPFSVPVPSGKGTFVRFVCFVCFVVKNPGISVNSRTTFRVSEQPHWAPVSWRAWEANSRKHLKLRYLHLIATNCASCASCDNFIFS
jgi:hypothetical protein